MIVGVGTDLCDIGRFERALNRAPGLLTRLFTEQERELGVASLAARFAAKEAVAKALGAPGGLSWLDAEVVRGQFRRPHLRVTGTVAAAAAALGVTHWHVSLTHDSGVASAFVVAEARSPWLGAAGGQELPEAGGPQVAGG